MKTVILALLVLVVVSQGEALKCYCGSSCQQNCYGPDQVCASIILSGGSNVTPIQGCMTRRQCNAMSSGASYANCCTRDLCNR